MLGTFPLILIVLPLLFQLLFGTMSLLRPILFPFKTVAVTSITLQIAFSIIGFSIASHNFSEYFDQHPNSTRCAMPLLGFATLSIFLAIVVIITIVIQFLIKKWKERKAKFN